MKHVLYVGPYFFTRHDAIRRAHRAGQITGNEKWELLRRAHALSLVPPRLPK